MKAIRVGSGKVHAFDMVGEAADELDRFIAVDDIELSEIDIGSCFQSDDVQAPAQNAKPLLIFRCAVQHGFPIPRR